MQDDQPAAKQHTTWNGYREREAHFTLFVMLAVLLLLLRRQDMKMTLGYGYGHRQRKIIEVACFAPNKHTHTP